MKTKQAAARRLVSRTLLGGAGELESSSGTTELGRNRLHLELTTKSASPPSNLEP